MRVGVAWGRRGVLTADAADSLFFYFFNHHGNKLK